LKAENVAVCGERKQKNTKKDFFLFEVREQWLDRQKKKKFAGHHIKPIRLQIISNQLDFKSSQTNLTSNHLKPIN
jgi:hypothetical protein